MAHLTATNVCSEDSSPHYKPILLWLFDSLGRRGGEKPGLMDDQTLLQPADSIKNQVSVGVRNSLVCYN